jgi:hypothetical protein
MTMPELLQVLLSVGLAVVGWFARVLWGAVSELKDDLAKLKEDLPIHYVRKDDFKEFRQSVIDCLHRIEAKIEALAAQKQDKPTNS